MVILPLTVRYYLIEYGNFTIFGNINKKCTSWMILDVQLWCSHLAVDNGSINNIKYSVN